MKRFKTIVFWMLCQGVSLGQDNGYTGAIPRILPQTPQAAAFTRYGEYPISPATGVPQIDIPLYTLQAKDIVLPISVSYHASGIKVEDVATPVGLGWTLNFGGVITRTIRGCRDYPNYTNNTVRSASQVQAMMSNSQYQNTNVWQRLVSLSNVGEDSQSDRYVYNFNGKSGVFVYSSSNNQLTTIPYAPIKIETTDNGFKVLDTDGLIYYFEGSESSGSAYLNSYGVTAWYVTRIESQHTGEVVTYKYRAGSSYTEYVTSQTTGTGTRYSFYRDAEGITHVQETHVASDRVIHSHIVAYNPLLIEEIAWRDKKITFSYTADRLDKYKDRLNGIAVSDGGKSIREINLGNNHYWGTQARNYRMRLNSLTVRGGDGVAEEQRYTFGYNNSVTLPGYKYYDADPSGLGFSVDYWGYFNGTSSIHLIPGDYCNIANVTTDRNPRETEMKAYILTEINYPTGGTTRFEYEANRVPNGYDYRPSVSVVGGLRVKSVVSITDGQEVRKTYEYTGKATETITADMFRFTQRKIYTVKTGGLVRHDSDWSMYTSTPLYSVTGWNGSPVFYTSVTEYFGSPTDNTGKTVKNYRESTLDMRHAYGSEVRDVDMPRFWSPFANFEVGLIRPLLDKEDVYEWTGGGYVLRQSVENSYSLVNLGKVVAGVRLGFRDDWTHDPLGGGVDLYSPYNSWSDYFDSNLAYYDIEAYRQFFVLTRTDTRSYPQNGSVVATVVHHGYDPSYRVLSPISTASANSDGTVITETYRHPFNESGAPYTEMVTKNILDPITRHDKSNGKGESLTLRREYRKSGALFVIDNIKTGKNGQLETRVSYGEYDSRGNPLQVTKTGGPGVSYVWGYSGQYPIAEVKNASHADIAHTSFEEEGKGGWSYTGSTVPASRFTGRLGYALSTTSPLSKGGLSAGKTYELTYWVLGTGQATVGGGTTVSSGAVASENGWTQYRRVFTGATSVSIGYPNSGSILIDEVRLYPQGAEMTTYTYDPLVGMTGQCDPSGKRLRYEYDGFGRLVAIRDQEGNVVEDYRYHYRP